MGTNSKRLYLTTICALGLILVLVSCSSQEKKTRASLHFKVGTAHLHNQNYTAALKELQKANIFDPDNPRILNNMGISYLEKKQYTLAEKHLLKALEINSNFTDAKLNLAEVYNRSGQSKKALPFLDESSKDIMYEYPAKVFSSLAHTYFLLNNFEKSIFYAKEALSLNKNNCFALGLIGKSYYSLKQYKNATYYLDKAIPICLPLNKDEAHYYSALSYIKLGSNSRAIARLKEVINLYKEGEYTQKARSLITTIK